MPLRITTAFIAGVFCLILAAGALAWSPRKKTNLSFAFFNVMLASWIFTELIVFVADHQWALIFERAGYIAASCVAFLFIKFLFSVIDYPISWPYRLIKWLTFIFVALSSTSIIIKDIEYTPGQFASPLEVHGPGYIYFLVFFIGSLFYSLFGLLHTYRMVSGNARNKLRSMAVIICLGIVALTVFVGNQLNSRIPPVQYLVVMLICSVMAYAIFKHRLLDIQLLSREATVWVSACITSTLPLVISACVARLMWSLPNFLNSPFAGTLICCILEFSMVIVGITVLQNRHARRFCRFLIILGLCNLTDLIPLLPPHHLSVFGYRLGYGGLCLTMLAFFYFWDGYFHGENPPARKGERWMIASMWIGIPFGGLTPFVLKTLAWDPHHHRPAMEVPGSGYWLFVIWFVSVIVVLGFWTYSSWSQSPKETKLRSGLWVFGSFLLAGFALLTYFLFVEQESPWYLYPILEFFSLLFLMGGLVDRMPLDDTTHTWASWASELSRRGLAVLAVSLLVGFLLAQKSWVASVGGFISGIFLIFLAGQIYQPVQEWVDQTFVFRKKFGHIARAKILMQKEWNLDSLEEALPLVTRGVLETTPYRSCTIAVMFDDQPKRPFFRSTQFRMRLGDIIEGQPWSEALVLDFLKLIRRSDALCLREEIKEAPLLVQHLDPLLFEAAVPLKAEGKIIGVVVVGPKEGKEFSFDTEDSKILTTLAYSLSKRLGPSVGLNLFRCIVNNTLHDVLGQNIGPLVDQLSIGRPVPPEKALRGLRTIREMLKDLRSYAHGELEKGKIREANPLNVEIVLRGIFEDHEGIARRKGLKLRLKPSPPLPKPRLDPVLVERCIGNLVTNAIKYTRKGFVEMAAHVSGGFLVVDVTDSGIGIPTELQQIIFEEGYRMPGMEELRVEGTGVGLSNVEDIMVAVGGHVKVESLPEKGSRFSLYFPLPAEYTDVKAVS